MEMALVFKLSQVYGIITGYYNKPAELAVITTATMMAAFKDWMDYNGVARSTIPMGIVSRIQT